MFLWLDSLDTTVARLCALYAPGGLLQPKPGQPAAPAPPGDQKSAYWYQIWHALSNYAYIFVP